MSDGDNTGGAVYWGHLMPLLRCFRSINPVSMTSLDRVTLTLLTGIPIKRSFLYLLVENQIQKCYKIKFCSSKYASL